MKKLFNSQTRINELFLAVILLVCYSYFFPRWADPNQNSRLDMVVAVVDDGTLQIDKYVSNTVDYAKYNGHYYSDKPPGAAFLAIPIYAGLKVVLNSPLLDGLVNRIASNRAFQATLKADGSGVYTDKVRFAIAQVVLTFFIAVIPTVLLGVLLYRLLIGFAISPVVSAVCVLLYGLFTPAFAYASAFYSHQLSTALLVGAFFLARSQKPLGVPRLLGIGLLLAYAVISEYPTVLISGILFVYTFAILYRKGQGKQIGWVLLVAVLGAAVVMIYNKAVFGSPFSLGYDFSENWTAQHHTGFMSLTMPTWVAVWGMTFGVFRGLFVLSPVLLLSIPGLIYWRRARVFRLEFWITLACIFSMFLFNSSSIMWWGGFSIGPRYFLPALPFLTLALGFAIQAWMRKPWLMVVAAILSVWSFAATWGMTLAGQAFPPDTIPNPWMGHALPNWQGGNIARSIATLLGLPGASSLIPLGAVLIVLGLVWWMSSRSRSIDPATIANSIQRVSTP